MPRPAPTKWNHPASSYCPHVVWSFNPSFVNFCKPGVNCLDLQYKNMSPVMIITIINQYPPPFITSNLQTFTPGDVRLSSLMRNVCHRKYYSRATGQNVCHTFGRKRSVQLVIIRPPYDDVDSPMCPLYNLAEIIMSSMRPDWVHRIADFF